MSKLKKIGEWIIDILIILIFVVSLFAMIGTITAQKTGVNSVFGKVINTVQSDSMAATFHKGDLVIGDKYDGSKLEKGEIITFRQMVNGHPILNTHRIENVVEISGDYYYETKGDNEDGIDKGYRVASDIVAVYSFKIGGVGAFIDWLKEPAGFIVCVVLPIVAVIIYQVYKIITILMKAKEEEKEELATTTAANTSEDVKAEIIRQYLESVKQQEAQQNAAPSEPSSDAPSEENTEQASEAQSEETSEASKPDTSSDDPNNKEM